VTVDDMNTSRLALAAEFMAVVPGPPAQPSPVHLTSAGQGG